ncbi:MULTISPECIES: alpha/beta fold hydrolase [Nostocales]|uniref:Alpha/beta hydrolase n=3 Tax=Nostocales TaxID=1161 RepID=A0A0C1R6L2_9CYAN|nr:alpha/beta hydrolase [Tolypothrix bouteillei]KAF3888477.1 alpha/beta hydrolase [Tolypothrix bouteillei VB521301]
MLHSEEAIVRTQGLKLWYKVSGTGPICIMPTPGWGPSSDMYFQTLTPLETMFTLVYLDTRGTGHSERPTQANAYTYDQFAADVDALRYQLGQDRVWLMGHSEAGRHALYYALQYPDHCAGLILLDAVSFQDEQSRMDMEARIQKRQHEPWFDLAYQAFTSQRMPESDAALATLVQSILPFYYYDVANIEMNAVYHAATSMSVDAFKGSTQCQWHKTNLMPRLGEIRVPTLVVVGSHDFICSPLHAHRLHMGIIGSKLILIENAGHFSWFEQPDLFFSKVKEGLTTVQ